MKFTDNVKYGEGVYRAAPVLKSGVAEGTILSRNTHGKVAAGLRRKPTTTKKSAQKTVVNQGNSLSDEPSTNSAHLSKVDRQNEL